MVLFKVVKKSHVEKPGDVHQFRVEFRSGEGHRLSLDVSELEYEGYLIGDGVNVRWDGRLEEGSG